MVDIHSEPLDTGRYVLLADYATLEAENKRLINIAGDALGFSEYQRDQDTVEVLANHAKRLADELATVKSEHCRDCCCSQSWKALGISKYTGQSIPEHITALRARCERLVEAARHSKAAIDNYVHKEWGIQELQESYDKLRAALEPFKETK